MVRRTGVDTHAYGLTIGGNASGIGLPGAVDGWSLAYTNDFDTPFATGAVSSAGVFPAPYASDLWAFPLGWQDDNAILNADDSQYDPQSTLSVSGSVLRQHMSVIAGSARSTVVGVYPSPGTGRLYGRFSVCFRVATAFHGWKTAWLLWPDSEVWPRDGEIDWPEGSLATGGEMDAFLHHQGAVSGGDQTGFSSGVQYTSTGLGSGWHVATTEWAADYCRFILDNVTIGTSYERVPNTPMGWRLMTVVQYTNFPTDQPTALEQGNVDIDWVAIWDDAGFVPYGFTQPAHTSVFTETWTGTNGAAWNTGRWTSQSTTTGASSSIQTNRGRLTDGTAAFYTGLVQRNAILTAPVDLLVEVVVRYVSITVEHYPRINFRSTSAAATSGYFVQFEADKISLRRNDASVETTIADADFTAAVGTDVNVEILAVGSELQVRYWTVGTRPSPPQLGGTDATYTGTIFSLSVLGGNAGTSTSFDYDTLTISSMDTGLLLAETGDALLAEDNTRLSLG